jgi:hypothetical protein
VALDRGTNYLLSRFRNGRLPAASDGDGIPAGADALAVYALLQAAQAIDRPDLKVDAPAVGRMLDLLRAMPMAKDHTTYDRSLRAAALAVYDRPADRHTLRGDALFLESQARDGAYTYDPVREPGSNDRSHRGLPDGAWDNSNSQYGALGVWSALDAGTEVPNRFWDEVRLHWVVTQRSDGQWGYSGERSRGQLSMTVAGIATMLVAEDQLGTAAAVGPAGRSPFTPVVASALRWLEAGDHAVDLPEEWPTYTLYGIERVGLASGFKTFGRHDWYRELAAGQLALQGADGSWSEGSPDPLIDTAYVLLFLARGRHPILMDKLRFDGPWANRPRDLAHLANFASKELERPLNWQVVSADDDWPSWMDAPVLYIAAHEPPNLSAAQVDKLRDYALAGGLIFTCNEGGAPAVDGYVADLAKRLFPRYALRDLPADHPVYRSLYPADQIAPRPPLQGLSNGSRLLMVHSPGDLGRTWQLRETVTHPAPFRLGLNLFIYAAGKANFLNKLRTPYLPEPTGTPVATVGVARVVYDGGPDGNWDPEPSAAPRFARQFQRETSIRVAVADVDAAALDLSRTPVALLTGTGPVRLSPAQMRAMHDYVAGGGVLLADACGGSAATNRDLPVVLGHAFPGVHLSNLPADDALLVGAAPSMSPLDLKLRPFASDAYGSRRRPMQGATVGRGRILYCPADVTTGLLGTNTWGVDGYEPDVAYGIVRNALLWAVER